MSRAEYETLRAECHALIDQLHAAVDVLTDDDDDERVVGNLKRLRVALLRVAFDYAGDPEAEETLARDELDAVRSARRSP